MLTSLTEVGLPTGAVPFPEYPGKPSHALYNKFDAASQRVSTTGEHAFIAPGPNDIRGPCAGLNAAANQYVFFGQQHRSITNIMSVAIFLVTVSPTRNRSTLVSGRPMVSTTLPQSSSKPPPCSSMAIHSLDAGVLDTTPTRRSLSVLSGNYSATRRVFAHTDT